MAGSNVTFAHKPLDRSLQQIRLISVIPEAEGPIRCNVKHANLDANPTPDYRALSYTWGPPSAVRRINVNNRPFVVRLNLYDFLHAFRTRLFRFRGCGPYEDEVQWLWIDQICIDQSVIEERNHQVQMMSNIYRRASYVYVWLGTSDTCTEAVMRTLKSDFRRYHSHRSAAVTTSRSRQQIADQDDRDETEPLSGLALRHFFGNSYWRRLWIVQEIMLARYIRVICGETLLSWEELQRFCSSGMEHLPTDATQSVPPQVIWLAEHALSTKTYSYPSLLWTFSTNECQDPRDKVYGLQGLLEQKDRAEIDYAKPVDEVFRDAATAMIEGADHLPRIRYGKGLGGLDFRKPVEDIFAEAVAIMIKEAEGIIQLRLVETVIILGDQMGLKLSELQNVKEKNRLLGETRAMWQRLACLYVEEYPPSFHAQYSREVATSEEFLVLANRLYNRYDALTATLRRLLDDILPLRDNKHNMSNRLLYVGTGSKWFLETRAGTPRSQLGRYRAQLNKKSILPYYRGDVRRDLGNVRISMEQESKHIERDDWRLDLVISTNFRFLNNYMDKIFSNETERTTSFEFGLQRVSSGKTSLEPRTKELSVKIQPLVNTRINKLQTLFKEISPQQTSLIVTVTVDIIRAPLIEPLDFGFNFDLNHQPQAQGYCRGTCMIFGIDEPPDHLKTLNDKGTPSFALKEDNSLLADAFCDLGNQRVMRVRDGELEMWRLAAVGYRLGSSFSDAS